MRSSQILSRQECYLFALYQNDTKSIERDEYVYDFSRVVVNLLFIR